MYQPFLCAKKAYMGALHEHDARFGERLFSCTIIGTKARLYIVDCSIIYDALSIF